MSVVVWSDVDWVGTGAGGGDGTGRGGDCDRAPLRAGAGGVSWSESVSWCVWAPLLWGVDLSLLDLLLKLCPRPKDHKVTNLPSIPYLIQDAFKKILPYICLPVANSKSDFISRGSHTFFLGDVCTIQS